MKLRVLSALAAALILAPSLAFAAPVTWYVHDVSTLDLATNDPTGTIEGSFKHDPDTGLYSDVAVVWKDTGGTVLETYSVPTTTAQHASSNFFLAAIPTGGVQSPSYSGPMIGLSFALSLAAAPGSATINGGLSRVGSCSSSSGYFCNVATAGGSYLGATGYVSTSLTPTPTAVPTLTEWAMILMGVALAGGAILTLQRRRQMV